MKFLATKANFIVPASAFLMLSVAQAQVIEFDLAKNSLTIPVLRANSTSLYNVVLLLGADGRLTPTSYSTKPADIVGSWALGASTITFSAEGTWSQTQASVSGSEADQIKKQEWPGSESGGTYSWNQTTGDLKITCPIGDTNGSAGFSDLYSGGFTSYKGSPIGTCSGVNETRKITVQGNSMSLSTIDGSFTASKVASSVSDAQAQVIEFDLAKNSLTIPVLRASSTSLYKVALILGADGRLTPTTYSSKPDAIVGSWALDAATITFSADGTWSLSQTVLPGSEADQIKNQVWAGIESGGTYSWNQTTGDLKITCPIGDTNGSDGFSGLYSGGFTGYKGSPIGTCNGANETRKITVQGNAMTLTTSDGTVTATKTQ